MIPLVPRGLISRPQSKVFASWSQVPGDIPSASIPRSKKLLGQLNTRPKISRALVLLYTMNQRAVTSLAERAKDIV